MTSAFLSRRWNPFLTWPESVVGTRIWASCGRKLMESEACLLNYSAAAARI